MKNFNLLMTGLGLLTISTLSNCQKEIEVTAPEISQANETTYYCDKVPFCHGTVQSFVTLNGDKKPIAIGIRFHESLLKGLPGDPTKNVADARLNVPKEGKDIGIDHIDFGWNPQGHEPDPIYTLPHFDLHFYKVSKADQAGVIPGPDPILVDPQYIPVDHVSGVVAVPNMGVHYVDVTSPEFNGNTFTSTFIYGFYRGKMTFLEPMFTRAFLLTKPQFTAPVKQPAKFQKSGYYPTSYRISYDNATQEYLIVADGLTFHAGS
jgi:hypothetical protein